MTLPSTNFGSFMYPLYLILILIPILVLPHKKVPVNRNCYYCAELRSKLTPAFSLTRTKQMFEMVQECGEELSEFLRMQIIEQDQITIDVKDFSIRYAIDVMFVCGFGLKNNAVKDKDSLSVQIAHKIFDNGKDRNFMAFLSPVLKEFLGFKVVHPEVSEFFFKTIRETVSYRKETGYVKNDFLQLLINLFITEDTQKECNFSE